MTPEQFSTLVAVDLMENRLGVVPEELSPEDVRWLADYQFIEPMPPWEKNPAPYSLTRPGMYLVYSGLNYDFPYVDEIVDALGSGSYGAAYWLADGRALKITEDLEELRCAEKIAANPGIHPNLPRVDEVGYFFRSGGRAMGYYIREELGDIFYDEYDREARGEINRELVRLERSIQNRTGIKLLDSRVDNWGIRPETGEWVFRDLRCLPQG